MTREYAMFNSENALCCPTQITDHNVLFDFTLEVQAVIFSYMHLDY